MGMKMDLHYLFVLRHFTSRLSLEDNHVQYTQTDTIRQFRRSIGTNDRIGTNRKECHSNGSVGEYAFH